VKPPKAKPKVQTQRSMHATLFLAPNNPSNLTATILSMIDYLMKKKFGLSAEVWDPNFAREAELLAP